MAVITAETSDYRGLAHKVLNSRRRLLFSSYASRLNWLCESSFNEGKAAGVKVTQSPPLKCTLRLREAYVKPYLHSFIRLRGAVQSLSADTPLFKIHLI
jgi:hypothetical protein